MRYFVLSDDRIAECLMHWENKRGAPDFEFHEAIGLAKEVVQLRADLARARHEVSGCCPQSEALARAEAETNGLLQIANDKVKLLEDEVDKLRAKCVELNGLVRVGTVVMARRDELEKLRAVRDAAERVRHLLDAYALGEPGERLFRALDAAKEDTP